MAVAAPGHAGLTAPSLGIATAQAEASELGALVTLTGSFPFEDMVARHYGVTLFIRSIEEKEQFVCFSSIWGPMAGATEIIKDGLDEKVVGQLAAIARPTTAARYISIEKGRMEVQLPPGFPPGEAEIQFFVVYEQVPVFSNPVPFLIGEVE